MFRLMLAFVLLSPLIGIILKEMGAYGLDTKTFGHYNGATFAYLVYLFFFYISFLFFSKIKLKGFRKKRSLINNYNTLGIVILIFNICSLLFLLFIVGGINVILGNVDRFAYRESWHQFGFIVLYIRNISAPLLVALLTFNYIKFKELNIRRGKTVLILNFLVIILIGFSYGFKSSIFFIMLPSLIILTWKSSWKNILIFASLGFISLMVLSVLFDKTDFLDSSFNGSLTKINTTNPLLFILYRLTVVQGDVPWVVWNLHEKGHMFFDYFQTLWAAIGNHNLKMIFNISSDDPIDYAKYNYIMMLTNETTNFSLSNLVKGGYNIIGTAFSEGIIAFGRIGIVIFGVLAGMFAGITKKILSKSYANNNGIIFVVMTVVFSSMIYRWLNGGGLVNIFHIANITNILLALFTLKALIIISNTFTNINKHE